MISLIYRICKVYFHLEDDSLSVVEIPDQNSRTHMTQGRIVRRHQVPFKEIDPEAGGLHHFEFLTMNIVRSTTNAK